jgi:hypothetical protein
MEIEREREKGRNWIELGCEGLFGGFLLGT